jgi:HEAT repeat protein
MVTLPNFIFYLQELSFLLFLVYIIGLVLLFPAWISNLRGSSHSVPLTPRLGLLYFLAGPYFLVVNFFWRFFLHRLIQVTMLLGASLVMLFPFRTLVRASQAVVGATLSLSDFLWEENVNVENRLAAKAHQNNLFTRNRIEQALMRFAYIPLLRKGNLARAHNFLNLGKAIPTVLAAIAQDKHQKDIKVRLAAIDMLGEEGYADELLVIVKDPQRQGEIVCHAAEALELRQEWQGRALEAWRFLLEHQDASTRLLAANHLKLSANLAARSKAITCLRSIVFDELVNSQLRIEAAAAVGRIGQMGSEEQIRLVDWMNESTNPADRLQAAFSLACLGSQPNALNKLRRYCYEYQHDGVYRLQAIEYLGRLDRAHDLRPLSRMTWVAPEHRQRAAEIMCAHGHIEDAAKSWLELALDTNVPNQMRQAALHDSTQATISANRQASTRVLVDALAKLGSEGEPSRLVRLEAGRTMVLLGLKDQARQIFLVLSKGNHSETSVRREAARELHNLALQTL